MSKSIATLTGRGIIAAAVLASASESRASESQDEFLARVQNPSNDVKFAAWKVAGQQDPSVIGPLSKLAIGEDPSVAKAAEECLNKIVHSVGKDKSDPKRKAVSQQLQKLLDEGPDSLRVYALRAFSLIGDDDVVPVIAPWLEKEEMREEAVYALERIPGPVSAKALVDALSQSPRDFKPRIIAALGHRKIEEAVGPLCVIMGGSDTDLAIDAMKALARIGKKVPEDVNAPEFDSLSPRQKAAFVDSVLLYADAQVKNGNQEDAFNLYNFILSADQPEQIEEHYHCAAIVVMSKIGNAGAVEKIASRLTYEPSYIVRKTAANCLKEMKGDQVNATLKTLFENASGAMKDELKAVLDARG
ncbi:MAG: HEAT repeat domain-containing protein [Candidatus Omnitrophica bacterium]|nr:HEAT repeat domain-containing protein [Candidatus Omnitrophota bacterium]